MGKVAQKPKAHVFTFRADDETAKLIRAAAAGHSTNSDFLLEAAEVKALDETYRVQVFDQLGSGA